MSIQDCSSPVHPAAIQGLKWLRAGEYWQAHESLEEAWRQEKDPVRNLYRGILGAAVLYLHITRGNYRGAIKVYQRVQKWIDSWPDVCRGIQVGRLRRDLNRVIVEIKRLGPDRLAAIDRSLLEPVHWT